MFRVTTLDPAKPPRNDEGEIDYAQDFFDRPAYLTVRGQLEGEIFAMRARQGLHVRPDVPGRELEHDAAPGRVLDDRAGDGVLRAGRQHGPGRAVPEAHLPRRAGRSAPRTWSSSTSTSTTTVIGRLRERRRRSDFRRLPLHRGDRASCKKSGKTVRVPGRLGQRPAGRARALPDRGELHRAGDPVRLPAHASSRSTCG